VPEQFPGMQKILNMKLKEEWSTGKPRSRWERRYTERSKELKMELWEVVARGVS
jgi:hypothetical protein